MAPVIEALPRKDNNTPISHGQYHSYWRIVAEFTRSINPSLAETPLKSNSCLIELDRDSDIDE